MYGGIEKGTEDMYQAILKAVNRKLEKGGYNDQLGNETGNGLVIHFRQSSLTSKDAIGECQQSRFSVSDQSRVFPLANSPHDRTEI